jgi:protein-arginine kinase activator protein McsA
VIKINKIQNTSRKRLKLKKNCANVGTKVITSEQIAKPSYALLNSGITSNKNWTIQKISQLKFCNNCFDTIINAPEIYKNGKKM